VTGDARLVANLVQSPKSSNNIRLPQADNQVHVFGEAEITVSIYREPSNCQIVNSRFIQRPHDLLEARYFHCVRDSNLSGSGWEIKSLPCGRPTFRLCSSPPSHDCPLLHWLLSSPSSDMDLLPDFLKPLEYLTRPFPHEAARAAVVRRDESTPHLLHALEWADQHPDEANDARPPYMLHIFALFVLAQFREQRAYAPIVQMFRNPKFEELTGAAWMHPPSSKSPSMTETTGSKSGPVVFDFRMSRAREGSAEFLSAYCGILQCDGY
jgi:Protein of unknown function (DUF1186)